MCAIIGRAVHQALERRGLLTAAAGVAASAAIFGPAASAAETADTRQRVVRSRQEASGHRTRLILLGTAGGPVFWPNTDRASTASAVVVDGHTYLVDCGHGSGKRLQQALYPTGLGHQTLKTLQAIFLTHLHSDHVTDYPALLLYGHSSEGLRTRQGNPLKVFGPGRRGEMEPVFAPPGRLPVAPLPPVNPDNSTPGTRDMTDGIYSAFATDINDRMRDYGIQDIRALVAAHDVVLPPINGFTSPNEPPAPDMDPFAVFEDDRVRVSATLVNHFPVWPAFAYRIDSADGSVVFSGDTAPSRNLVRMTKGADVLVHEVIVTSWVDKLFPAPRNETEEAFRRHLLSAHTPVEEVGKVAEQAGVSTLCSTISCPATLRHKTCWSRSRSFQGGW